MPAGRENVMVRCWPASRPPLGRNCAPGDFGSRPSAYLIRLQTPSPAGTASGPLIAALANSAVVKWAARHWSIDEAKGTLPERMPLPLLVTHTSPGTFGL